MWPTHRGMLRVVYVMEERNVGYIFHLDYENTEECYQLFILLWKEILVTFLILIIEI